MERESGLLYLSIARGFLDKIHRGEWLPGQQIPGIRELAASFTTSVKTINRALEELDNRGLLERTQGRGIFLLPRDRWPQQTKAPFICFTPSRGDPVSLSLVAFLADEISQAGEELIIHTYQIDDEQPFSRLPQTCSGIFAVDFAPPPEFFFLLSQGTSDLPLLYVGGFPPPSDFKGSHLTWDLEGGLEIIVEYLMDKGHGRIGYLGGSLSLDRDPGFLALRRVLHRRGLAVERNFCRATGGYGSPGGRRTMEDLIDTIDGNASSPLPSAFIALYDGTAAGAMAAVRETGREIPEDIAFVGCENSEVARTIHPALTSLSLEREPAAALAVKLLDLLRRGQAGKRSPLGVKIPLVLEERESSQPDNGEFIDRWI